MDVTLTVGSPVAPPASPVGRLEWPASRRLGLTVLLDFPGTAQFRVSLDGSEVACSPDPRAASEDVGYLFLDQVLPRVAHTRGWLPIHASAVATPAGGAVLVGPTGRGKSTLAAAFARHGGTLLADDAVYLEEGNGEPRIHPSYPCLRLWPDSAVEMFGAGHAGRPVTALSEKSRFLAEGLGSLRSATAPVRCAAIYELGVEAFEERARAPRISPLTPRQGLLLIVENLFRLGGESPDSIQREFDRLCKSPLLKRCFRLEYTRSYGDLGDVSAAVLAHVESL